MDPHLEFDIRYTTLADAGHLRSWLVQKEVQKWFPIGSETEIDGAVQCWVGFSKYNCSLTATVDGIPCGIGTLFLMPYKKVAHHCLFKLVVDPRYRRQGIGRSLLKNLKHLAKSHFSLELLHIEVFEANPLIHLLQELDFKEFARQEHFVKEGNRYLARILYQSYL
ncbi:MAG: GNAT family N-acetyltransferase [Chlamydiales bacterium]|nr:GNAT family N-acetyltransferase [Chlamydiales bacterium]